MVKQLIKALANIAIIRREDTHDVNKIIDHGMSLSYIKMPYEFENFRTTSKPALKQCIFVVGPSGDTCIDLARNNLGVNSISNADIGAYAVLSYFAYRMYFGINLDPASFNVVCDMPVKLSSSDDCKFSNITNAADTRTFVEIGPFNAAELLNAFWPQMTNVNPVIDSFIRTICNFTSSQIRADLEKDNGRFNALIEIQSFKTYLIELTQHAVYAGLCTHDDITQELSKHPLRVKQFMRSHISKIIGRKIAEFIKTEKLSRENVIYKYLDISEFINKMMRSKDLTILVYEYIHTEF